MAEVERQLDILEPNIYGTSEWPAEKPISVVVDEEFAISGLNPRRQFLDWVFCLDSRSQIQAINRFTKYLIETEEIGHSGALINFLRRVDSTTIRPEPYPPLDDIKWY